MAYSSYTSVPMYSGSAGGAAIVASALRGNSQLKLLIDGDSNEMQAAAGGMRTFCRNAALLQVQDAINEKLISCGFKQTSAMAATSWIATAPVRHATSGTAALTSDGAYTGLTSAAKAAILAALPANWRTYALVLPSSAGTGIFAGLQSTGDNYPPEIGIAIGPGVTSWDTTDGKTYIDAYFLTCNAAGFTGEAVFRVTQTDTTNAAVGVSAALTYTTGSGGISSLALTDTPLITSDDSSGLPTIRAVRVGPINFGGKKTAQVNITGDASGKVICLGYEFVKPTGKGLAFPVIAAASNHSAATWNTNYPNDGQAYAKYVALNTQATIGFYVSMGMNSSYVDSATADTYVSDTVALINRRKGHIGNGSALVVVGGSQYRDGNAAISAQDLIYDTYTDAMTQAGNAGRLGPNWIVLNIRRAMNIIGHNWNNEDLSATSIVTSGAVGGVGCLPKPWDGTTTLGNNTLIGCANAPSPILTSASGPAAALHPIGGTAPMTNGYKCAYRIFSANDTSGNANNGHHSPGGYRMLCQTEINLLERAAAYIGAPGYTTRPLGYSRLSR